ncbi:MAG: hypothetical protein JWQ54_5068 [Mucilaginibacter sp.]|nr:hypothetical protein [Mucilaginibacter sp.]
MNSLITNNKQLELRLGRLELLVKQLYSDFHAKEQSV